MYDKLIESLEFLNNSIRRYDMMVSSGDCGNWDVNEDDIYVGMVKTRDNIVYILGVITDDGK